MPEVQLPRLYKYLDPNGAILTLQNRCFRHAKPSDFEDDFDVTAVGVFRGNSEETATQFAEALPEVILKNLEKEVTFKAPRLRALLNALIEHQRNDPDTIKRFSENLSKIELFSVGHLDKVAKQHLKEINEYFQRYRILCVTHTNTSQLMWENYAKDHEGIVIEIEPNFEKCSKYQLFKKVHYEEEPPVLFPDVYGFLENALFAGQDERDEFSKEVIERIIYTKTTDWAYEEEYRLAISLGTNEEDYNTLPYHPEELAKIYLGKNIDEGVRNRVVKTALTINRNVQIFQASLTEKGEFEFENLNLTYADALVIDLT